MSMWEQPTILQTALFRTLCKHLTNIRTAHFSASSHRTCRPITSQFISNNHRRWCGNIRKVYKRPFSGPYAKTLLKNGPFQCLKPQASSANHKSVYFDQSQGVLWERPTSLQTPLFRTLPNHRTNLRTAHFSASSHRPDRSITNQFISTNHRSV